MLSFILFFCLTSFFLGRCVFSQRVSLCCTCGAGEPAWGSYGSNNVLLLGLLLNHLIIGWWGLSHEKEIHSHSCTLFSCFVRILGYFFRYERTILVWFLNIQTLKLKEGKFFALFIFYYIVSIKNSNTVPQHRTTNRLNYVMFNI